MSSQRLPGKVLAPFGRSTVIEVLLARLARSHLLDGVVIATSNEKTDDPIAGRLPTEEIYRGSLLDVRSRYIKIAKKFRPENIIRITADCPLTCFELVDELIIAHQKTSADYTANCNFKSFPKGFDIEVFRSELLFDANFQTNDAYDIEHVTPWMYKNGNAKVTNIEFSDFEKAKLFNFSVDTQPDLDFLRSLSNDFSVQELSFKQIWNTIKS
jgi:spore coat polysaccharide biosynthesis protein SpsF (cytidylyltransferase family)